MAVPRVLIVDDARFMRMMLTDLLSRSGLEVVGHACDGAEALVKFRETRPDVVTMDIMMPGTDGLQALRNLVAEEPRARVIIISALEHAHLVSEALALGAARYVVKPFSPDQVVEIVKAVAEEPARAGVES